MRVHNQTTSARDQHIHLQTNTKLLRRLNRYRAPLAAFLASRLIMLLAIVYAANFMSQNPDGEFWNVESPWFRYLLRWDAGWYSRIARQGYAYEGNNLIQNDVVFFPLYPLLARVVSLLSGLPEHVSLLLISNVAILVASVLIYDLIEKSYDRTTAFYSV